MAISKRPKAKSHRQTRKKTLSPKLYLRVGYSEKAADSLGACDGVLSGSRVLDVLLLLFGLSLITATVLYVPWAGWWVHIMGHGNMVVVCGSATMTILLDHHTSSSGGCPRSFIVDIIAATVQSQLKQLS